MSLFGAMTASVAGIGAQGQAISVISDNLANTNTIGYKASRTLFSQMVTSSGTSGTTYNSGGVGTSVLRAQGSQGSFITSTSKTDLAISGNGLFVVSDNKVNSTQSTTYYTRAGSFSENKEGYLVNPDGFYLQGWRTESDGTIINIQEPQAIELQSVGVSAKKTENFAIKANLNNTETVNDIYASMGPTLSLDQALQSTLNDPSLADYVADVRVYDAQGGARDMTIHFTKRSANTWDWQLMADATDVQAGLGLPTSTDGSLIKVGGGVLEFNTNGGTLKSATGTDVNIQWANGVDASSIAMNFGQFTGGPILSPGTGTPPPGTTVGLTAANRVLGITVEKDTLGTGTFPVTYTAGVAPAPATLTLNGETINFNPTTTTQEIYFPTNGVRMTVGGGFNPAAIGAMSITTELLPKKLDGIGTDGMTQLASAYNTGGVNQDGFGAGSLASIAVDESGFVSGTFTNGEVKKLFKVAIAAFQNPGGLEVVSGSLLQSTDASGQALLKQAGVGGAGRIVSGSLEGSTTDIAGEFSNMIVAQRAFQASSKVITTVDQMLNELLQLR